MTIYRNRGVNPLLTLYFQQMDSFPILSEDESRQKATTLEKAYQSCVSALPNLLTPSQTDEINSLKLARHQQVKALFAQYRRHFNPNVARWHTIVRKLWRKPESDLAYSRRAGINARNELINGNLRHVVWNAASFSNKRFYKNSDLELSNLICIGNLGLIRAANGYELSYGTRFSTYATWWIRAHIKHVLRNRLPPMLSLSYSAVESESTIEETLADNETLSADESAARAEKSQAARDILNPMLNELDSTQKEILVLRFGLKSGVPRTREEVGLDLKMPVQEVNRIERNALFLLQRRNYARRFEIRKFLLTH